MYNYIFLSLIFILGIFVYRKFKIMDKPKNYGWQRDAVPYSFGFFVNLVWLVSLFIKFGFANLQINILGLVVFFLTLLGFIDDRINIAPKFRLLFQFILALMLVRSGFTLSAFTNFFTGDIVYAPMILEYFSVLWLVFLINSMNFLDGLPSLTSGVSSVALVFLLFLSQVPNFHSIDQALLIDLAFLTLPFWILTFCFEFPFKNPKFLQGDSGATVMGLLLAVFSIMAGGKLAILSMVLLLPLIDVLFVIAYRVYNKKPFWKGDYRNEHLHHILRFKGYNIASIILVYLLISIIFGFIAIFLWNATVKLIALVFLSLFILFFLFKIYSSNKALK